MQKTERQLQYKISFSGLRKIVRNPKISKSARLLCVDLLLYAGLDGVCFPSEITLGKDMGLTDRHIRNLITELKNNGLGWERGGFGRSNRYSFNEEIYFLNDEDNRKAASLDPGNQLPVDSGSTLPPKEVIESSHEKDSQYTKLLQFFKDLNGGTINDGEQRKFLQLSKNYSPSLMEYTLQIAKKRKKSYIKVSYLALILKDAGSAGVTGPEPMFNPCKENGCEGGYIFTNNTYKECSCRVKFNEKSTQWTKQFG